MKLKNYEVATLKKKAMIINRNYVEVCKKSAKIAELQAEVDALNAAIEGEEATVKHLLPEGKHIMDVITKKVEEVMDANGNVKLDAEGRPMKKTTYVYVDPEETAPIVIATPEEVASGEFQPVEE